MSQSERHGIAETPYVFSVDLEDVRDGLKDGARYPGRVPAITSKYLRFLGDSRGKGTFFVVGQVARAQPELIARIVASGHEIGCHSDRHVPLTRQDAAQMREDLLRNLDALHAAGAREIQGYRAPCFSLTEETRWAYDVLAELGFTYSSSVLPAPNPLHGWAAFGPSPRLMNEVLELPMTLLPGAMARVPMGGGVYFRVLPAALLLAAFKRRRREGTPVLGYFHPYDADPEQQFPHPDFARLSPCQWLMKRNRDKVFDRLEAVKRLGFTITNYAAHAQAIRSELREEMAG